MLCSNPLSLVEAIALCGTRCVIIDIQAWSFTGVKLPAPSFSMPCDCRILQSLTKGQVLLVPFETVQRSPLVIDFDSKYDVLVKVSACTH